MGIKDYVNKSVNYQEIIRYAVCHTADCSAGCCSYAKLSLLWSLLILFFKSLVKLCGGRSSLSKRKKMSGRNKGFNFFCVVL